MAEPRMGSGRSGNDPGTVGAYCDAMDVQQTRSKLGIRNKIFVVRPAGGTKS